MRVIGVWAASGNRAVLALSLLLAACTGDTGALLTGAAGCPSGQTGFRRLHQSPDGPQTLDSVEFQEVAAQGPQEPARPAADFQRPPTLPVPRSHALELFLQAVDDCRGPG